MKHMDDQLKFNDTDDFCATTRGEYYEETRGDDHLRFTPSERFDGTLVRDSRRGKKNVLEEFVSCAREEREWYSKCVSIPRFREEGKEEGEWCEEKKRVRRRRRRRSDGRFDRRERRQPRRRGRVVVKSSEEGAFSVVALYCYS